MEFNTVYAANLLQRCRRLVVPGVYLTLDPKHSAIYTTMYAVTQRVYLYSLVLPGVYIHLGTV